MEPEAHETTPQTHVSSRDDDGRRDEVCYATIKTPALLSAATIAVTALLVVLLLVML